MFKMNFSLGELKMKKQIIFGPLTVVVVFGLVGFFLQADFIQCNNLGVCTSTNNADLINGTPVNDNVQSQDGDDIMFGHDGQDYLEGDGGNDIAFGGLGSDRLRGVLDDDILLAGPDEPNFSQDMFGGGGNDIFNVFVGEVTECLIIGGDTGVDVVNLIGFGPYVGIVPFGENSFNGFDNGVVTVVDPITGGTIFIIVDRASDAGTETINGLMNPNVLVENNPQSQADCQAIIPPIE
jgi:hypothetical protein